MLLAQGCEQVKQENLFGLYLCSTKTREVLGNPSPTPERFPETREISRGRSPKEISRVEGNLEGRGDGFPNTFRVLVEHGQSLSINFSTGSGSGNPSLWCGQVKINPFLLMVKE